VAIYIYFTNGRCPGFNPVSMQSVPAPVQTGAYRLSGQLAHSAHIHSADAK